MNKSIIGANVALRYLKNYQAHVDYWHEVNPAYQVAFIDKPEHVPYLLDYAAALPQSMIVARIYHPLDGGFHLAPTGAGDTRHYVSSPSEYHSAYGWLGQKENIILNIFNEPKADDSPENLMRLSSWMLDYIPIAAASKTKSVLFNWADRNPRIIDGMFDPLWDNCLRMMAAHPDLFYMGCHLYGPDEITSHLDSYVKRCQFLGIKPPKVIASEFGLDSTGGIERGYKSRSNYRDIYAQWQETVVKGSLKPYIDSGILAGLCVFQEGNSGGFDDFDFEIDSAYKTEIKRAALAGEISVPAITPSPVPSPAPAPIVVPSPSDPIVSPSPFIEISSQYAAELAMHYKGLWETWDKIAKQTKPS